jgi:hypothetical protein
VKSNPTSPTQLLLIKLLKYLRFTRHLFQRPNTAQTHSGRTRPCPFSLSLSLSLALPLSLSLSLSLSGTHNLGSPCEWWACLHSCLRDHLLPAEFVRGSDQCMHPSRRARSDRAFFGAQWGGRVGGRWGREVEQRSLINKHEQEQE